MKRNIHFASLAFIAGVVCLASTVTARQSQSVKISQLAVSGEGRLVTAEQELKLAANENDNISGPNDQYQALNNYEKSGQYNANVQYSANSQYNAHNQYSAQDQYNAHNQYTAQDQYNAHNQYNAHDQYNAHNQYNRSGSGADDESELSHSNFTFPSLMGVDHNKTLPSPIVVAVK